MGWKYTYKEESFLREDANSFYLLGAFMTDGCVRHKRSFIASFEVAKKDKDWLDIIKNQICEELPTPMYKNCNRISFSNINILSWLVSWGCTPRKTFTLDFPKIPKQYLPDFLRGCIDGDGSITIHKYFRKDRKCFEWTRSAMFCGSSSKFIEKFEELLKQMNIKYCKSQAKSRPHMFRGKMTDITSPHWRITMNGKNAQNFLNWIYYPEHELSMPRKNKLAEKFRKWTPKR